MSAAQPSPQTTAVRKGETPNEQKALADLLATEGITSATEFAPKDDDEMNVETLAGKFDRLVFADLDALLAAVWKGEAELDRWESLGVRIDLASPPPATESWRTLLPGIYQSLARYRKKQRQRQIVTGLVLSMLGLIAVAILLFLIPPAS